jgi:hypothetical protein
MQSIRGNHWLGGTNFSRIGWCLKCSLNWMLKKKFNISTSYVQIHPIVQKDAFHDSNTLILIRCLFRATQDVDGHRTICSLLFVRLPWIRDVYEHELFITQPKPVETYELLFNRLWKKKTIQNRKLTSSWLVGWEHYWVKHPWPKSKY